MPLMVMSQCLGNILEIVDKLGKVFKITVLGLIPHSPIIREGALSMYMHTW